MARFQEDELFGDDLDAVLQAIDEDFIEKDQDLSSEINHGIVNTESDAPSKSYTCSFCEKVCVSQRGLSRHVNTKHKDKQAETSTEKPVMPEDRMHPLVLKSFLKISAEKLSTDECYPQPIMDEFKALTFTTLQDVLPCYNLIKSVVRNFNGNAEKFYPEFYKVFSGTEAPFTGLSRHSSLLLGFEVANHVLAYLTGSKIHNDVVCFKHEETVFSEKENSIIYYLAGYVVGTLYRRIRFSKKCNIFNDHHLSFLLACKFDGDETDTTNHKLVNIKDRGGLWKVNTDVFSIFSTAESYFLKSTKHFTNKIDCKSIVSSMVEDPWVMVKFSKIKSKSEEKVRKEVVLNLLEDMLTLYIRVRSHSYAKSKQQLHKIQNGKLKTRSLRTDIKNKSTSLDFGH